MPALRPSQRLFYARIISLLLLGVVVWPVPRMLSHVSPQPTVLHYESAYAAMLTLYVAASISWAAIIIWLFTPTSRSNWNRFCRRRPFTFLGMLLGSGLILIMIRVALAASIIVLPGSFAGVMVAVPMIVFAGISCMAGLLTDPESAAQLEQALAELGWWKSLTARIGRLPARNSILAGVVLGLMAGFFLWLSLRPEYWQLPLFFDSSVHLYMGQHLLNGGIPYRTMIYFHPPGRFLISVIWNMGARLTGTPVLAFVRGWDLVVVIAMLLVTFASGRLFTGRISGGLLAAAAVLGTELPLVLIYSDAPTFRLTTILIMMIGIWLGQREKWLAAGICLTFAGLLWLPMIGQIAMVALAILLSVKSARGRSLARMVGGMLVVMGIAVLAMAAWGVLRETFMETIGAVVLSIGSKGGTSDQTLLGTLLSYAAGFRETIAWTLRNDWEIIALSFIGLILALLRNIQREHRAPSQVVPLLALIPMGVMAIFDNNGAPRDTAVFVMLWGGFAAWGLIAPIDLVRAAKERLGRLQIVLVSMGFLAVLLIGSADSLAQRNYLESLPILDITDQVEMASDLANALRGKEEVLSLGNFWYQVLANENNALPVTTARPRVPVNEVSGWDQSTIEQAITANPPVIIMGWPDSSNLPGPMTELYQHMGNLRVSHDQPAQTIFVYRERPDITGIANRWPLDR